VQYHSWSTGLISCGRALLTYLRDVTAGKPVQIVDERHGKPLALGIALFDAADLLAQEKGKISRTWHYVGDDIWNLEF
jgi:Predicted RNA-binding protein (contains PUA domain)